MLIAPALLDELVAHAREEYDAECCGLIAYQEDGGRAQGDGRAVLVRRAQNVFAGRQDAGGRDAGRKRFEIDGRELLHAYNDFEQHDLKIGAIYHSHTHTAPYPSQTDVNFAANWPGLEWVIIGLAGAQPEVRSYLIEGGRVKEVALEVR
ncbi:MAG TPA: M67 family metallopeptidase [Solirubrobacteraceae bacterium]|nr:M67 family metallopeptidase [Solirubrobacteraceae bacterium]